MPGYTKNQPKTRFILPFATPGKSRLKDFTKNMERAAVLYLAESNRKKGESQFLRKTDEKLVFIAEVYYPFWLVPYKNANLMFDGLGMHSHTFSGDDTVDVEFFNKDLKRNHKTTEAYTAALTRNMYHFKNVRGTIETKIEALITDPGLKETLKNYLPHKKEIKKPPTTKILIKPIIRTLEIKEALKQLSNLTKKINKDIANIDVSMKLLNTNTARSVRALKSEIKKSLQTQQRKTQKAKLRSNRKLLKIQSQYNQKIARTSKRYKKKLLELNKNQVKLKKAQKNRKKEAKRCEAKIQTSRIHNRKRGERHWFLKLEDTEKEIPSLHKKIEENAKQIRHLQKAQKLELTKQRIECCKRIETANKKFLDLQGSTEAETIMKHQEIATLEGITRYLIKSMQELIQKKRLFKTELDEIKMPMGKLSFRMVYIPFYLVRYEKENKKRYTIYPPSIVADMNVLTQMKGAIGTAKVKALLKPRSEALANFLNNLTSLLEKKPMLEKNLTEKGIEKSILLRKKLRASVKKGLKELENENWISQSEHQAFSQILYVYASAIKRRTNPTLIGEISFPKCLIT